MIKKQALLTISVLLTLTLVLSVSYINASGGIIQRLCLKDGETIKFSLCNPAIGDRTCTSSSGCIYCVNMISPGVYCSANPNSCNKLTSGCNIMGGNNSSFDSMPPVLTIISPTNGYIFNSRMALFNIRTDEPASLFYTDNSNGRKQWKTITTNFVLSYQNSFSFYDGLNNITIKAIDKKGNSIETTRYFYVDSQAPKIKFTIPAKGFSDGTFNISFTEMNPATLKLNYGNSLNGMRNVNLNIGGCSINKGIYTCSVKVNLADFNGQGIQYNFELVDIAGNKDTSKTINLKVDTIPPVINNQATMFKSDNKNAYFNISISELNFKEVSYIDKNAKRPMWIKICTILKNGICYKKVSFSKGSHSIDVQVIDQASNKILKSFDFDIN